MEEQRFKQHAAAAVHLPLAKGLCYAAADRTYIAVAMCITFCRGMQQVLLTRIQPKCNHCPLLQPPQV